MQNSKKTVKKRPKLHLSAQTVRALGTIDSNKPQGGMRPNDTCDLGGSCIPPKK